MPKYSVLLPILIAVFFTIAWFFKQTRLGKNMLGRYKKKACCPNCGDSWYWKKSGHISFSIDAVWGVSTEDGDFRKIQNTLTRSLAICQDCLSKPDQLDLAKIVSYLRQNGWQTEHLELAETAIRKHIQSNHA